MSTIRIAQTVRNVAVLGPYSRFGLWVQGCRRNCPGCVSPDTHSLSGGYEKEVGELAEEDLGKSDLKVNSLTVPKYHSRNIDRSNDLFGS